MSLIGLQHRCLEASAKDLPPEILDLDPALKLVHYSALLIQGAATLSSAIAKSLLTGTLSQKEISRPLGSCIYALSVLCSLVGVNMNQPVQEYISEKFSEKSGNRKAD